MSRKIYTLLAFSFLFFQQLPAQLFIDNSYTVEEMVTDFFDNSCVTPTNITFTGATQSVAFFDAGGTGLGVDAGIFLSTGDVLNAIGPNNGGGTGSFTSAAGDVDLENLLGFQTFDAAVLEMDIVATGDLLEFSYVFASEEYPEYVGAAFNDAFAFFISGPGMTGMTNIAMIPGSADPVAINNINSTMNSNLYIDNIGGQFIEFDGYTTEMTATATVTPNETYHVKIVVGDVADGVFDSGIFLGVKSLCGSTELKPMTASNFSLDGSTATFTNDTKYAKTHFWDFGDNNTSTEKNPAPHTYAADGLYEVSLISTNYCCSDTTTFEVQIGEANSIEDIENKPYQFSPNPVIDFAQINFDDGKNYVVNIFDATGKLVLSRIGNDKMNLNFSEFQAGLYFMEIKNGKEIFMEKIVKY